MWRNSISTMFELRTFSADSKSVRFLKCLLSNADLWTNPCSTMDFICIKQIALNNTNKQVNDAAGPHLATNTVSLTQHSFSSDHILRTVQLLLTYVFNIYRRIKWHSHLYSHLNGFGSWNLHSTNADFDQLRRFTNHYTNLVAFFVVKI